MPFYDFNKSCSTRPAIITEAGKKIDYSVLHADADKLGHQIKRRSLVFLLCSNDYETVAAYIGLLKSRSVPVLIQSTISDGLLSNLLATYKPSYIYLPQNREIKLEGIKPVYETETCLLVKTAYDIDYAIHNDVALLLTTSGSTGSPKFVKQSYKNINANAESIARYLNISEQDRPIATMPMSYTYMLSIIQSHLLKGASICMTGHSILTREFWALLNNVKATTFGGVPYTYQMLKKLRFAQMELPSLTYLTQAGGHLGEKTAAEFIDICHAKNLEFIVMYGQAEATARMAYLPWEHARRKPGSIGISIPGGRFWLENENGKKIETSDTEGELVYQGDNVSMGYATTCYDLEKGDLNQGQLHTGDLAKRDDDGFYYITGRKKRFLKMFGNRVNLNEVEGLVSSAGFGDAACTGQDDLLQIFITREKIEPDVRKYISQQTGLHPSGIRVTALPEIPRSESGKVLYSQLPEQTG